MTDDDSQLREQIRALADRFEAEADPPERVAARLGKRSQPSRLPSPALLIVVGTVIIVASVGLRALLPGTFGGAQAVLPVGLFASELPDADGECVAIRVYDTTQRDQRIAFWRWAGTVDDGCAARRSNLFMGEAVISEVTLPARTGTTERSGFRVDDPDARPRALPAVVLDPSYASGNDLAGYWSLAEIVGEPTLTLERIEELTVPYRPE